ncbi:hypothetical protein [Candidatus Uabimicrobium sp. HlEnr_7]|uniref:hypothetical protein n=1 Tax=Candidatus Uabimicrobium helgolandensis TaxID=3095367 RepID=UPI00355816EA
MFKSGKQKTTPSIDTPQKEIPAKISKKRVKKSNKKEKDTLNSRQLDILLTLFVHPFVSEKIMLGFINLKHSVNASTMRRDLNKLSKEEYLVHVNGKIFYTNKGISTVEKQFGVPKTYDIKESACAYDIGSKMAEIEYYFLEKNHSFYLGGFCSFHYRQQVSVTDIQIGNEQEQVDGVFMCGNSNKTVLYIVHFFSNPFHFPSLARSYFHKTSQRIYKFKEFRLSPQDKAKFDALFVCSLNAMKCLIIVDSVNEKYIPSNLNFCKILTLDAFKQVNWEEF